MTTIPRLKRPSLFIIGGVLLGLAAEIGLDWIGANIEWLAAESLLPTKVVFFSAAFLLIWTGLTELVIRAMYNTGRISPEKCDQVYSISFAFGALVSLTGAATGALGAMGTEPAILMILIALGLIMTMVLTIAAFLVLVKLRPPNRQENKGQL